MTKGPYIAERSGTVWWNVYDTRTGEFVSYPTNKRNCLAEVETMNRAYAEAVTEVAFEPDADGIQVDPAFVEKVYREAGK